MSKEPKDKPIEGHSYDGIQEYDNPLPTWWTNMFWATIVFAIGYSAYYLTGWGPTVPQALDAELATAKAGHSVEVAKAITSEISEGELVKAALDSSRVEAGKAIFALRCLACHGASAEGLIGPNLTDNTWINGGSLKEIYHTVKEGVPEKGMISWKTTMSEEEMVSVVAFVRSIQNTNHPGKAPQGNPAEPTPLTDTGV